MESIYYVLSWACHRRCKHCYEERFRPYVRDELKAVVSAAEENFPKIIANLPERLTYLDLEQPDDAAPGGYVERTSRVIVSGGEVLLDPVRENILYPALEQIRDKYRSQGGVKLVVQTTGDLLTEKIIEELLQRGIYMISVAGMDDFHVGMEGEKRIPLQEQLTRWFEAAGMRPFLHDPKVRAWDDDGPNFSFFGATEDAWIGKIWPRGRAWSNGLSRATIADNFCNAWSGGLNFLNRHYSGSEVSIDPNGDVFPCCLKTKAPLGNLTEERLEDIIDSLVGHPAFEAISMGHPERMGIAHGWNVATFLKKSETVTVDGRPYRNLCIGCDRFHTEVLAGVLEDARLKRLSLKSQDAAD